MNFVSAGKTANKIRLPKNEKYKERNALFHHPAYLVVRPYHRLRGKCCRSKRHRTGCCNIIHPLFTAHFTNTGSQWAHGHTVRYAALSFSVAKTRETDEKEEERENIKKIGIYLMLLPLCTTCRGKQWSKAFHHLMLPEYKTLFSFQLEQNTDGRGRIDGWKKKMAGKRREKMANV